MIDLIVDVLAAVRFARLVQDDGITARLRDLAVRIAPQKAPEGLKCPWCGAVWGAGAVMVLRGARGDLGRRMVRCLAVAEIAGRIRLAEKEAEKA